MSISITEKIVHTDAFEVNLYKDGIFWRAYQQSAYAIHQIRPAYQPKKEKIKKVGHEVVSIGFPDGVLKDILLEFELVKREEKKIYLKVRREPIDLEAFEVWKEALSTFIPTCENCKRLEKMLNEQKNEIAVPQVSTEEPMDTEAMIAMMVYHKVCNLDLSNKTPMGCMTFLSELKIEMEELKKEIQ